MIKSIKHKGLRELYEKGKTRLIKPDFIKKCSMILTALEAATEKEEMNYSGSYFHGLQGKPKRYAVKVNKNYRITFEWDDGAVNVDLEDYH